MFKKHFLLFLLLFCDGMAVAQDNIEEANKTGWSTKKKVVVGVAAVAVVTATGVIIYYGPVAVIAYIKAAAVAAKVKVVAVATKVAGATNVVTLGEGSKATTFVMFENGTATTAVATGGQSTVIGAVGGGACSVVGAAGNCLADVLKNSEAGSTIRVVRALKDPNVKNLHPGFVDGLKASTVVAVTPTDQITVGDLNRAYSFTKETAQGVASGVRDVADIVKEAFKTNQEISEEVENEVKEEWVPKPLIADRIKKMCTK